MFITSPLKHRRFVGSPIRQNRALILWLHVSEIFDLTTAAQRSRSKSKVAHPMTDFQRVDNGTSIRRYRSSAGLQRLSLWRRVSRGDG